LVFRLGGLAMQQLALAAALGVAVALLLAGKSRLHRFVRHALSEQELHDALLLAAAAAIVLPLLPDRTIDPWQVLNPRKLWLLAGIVMARGTKRVLAVLLILAGIVGGGIGVYDALTAKDSVLDAAAEELAPTFGASAEQVRTALDQAIDAGQLSVTISIGLYVVIAGGVEAVVGGILGLRGSSEPAAAGQTAAPAQPAVAVQTAPGCVLLRLSLFPRIYLLAFPASDR